LVTNLKNFAIPQNQNNLTPFAPIRAVRFRPDFMLLSGRPLDRRRADPSAQPVLGVVRVFFESGILFFEGDRRHQMSTPAQLAER
jgi:hypothetical protein